MSDRPFLADWRNAVRDSDLPRTAKLVAFVLSTYMRGTGTTGPKKEETPSIVTLARGASLGRKVQKDNTATKDALERLEADGFLDIDRRRGRRGWTYTAVIPRAAEGLPGVGIPRRGGAKSPANVCEIPRRDGGECVLESERSNALQHKSENGEDLDPTSRARRRLEDPDYAGLARRLWGLYAPNHFVQALCERGTRLEVAQAVRRILEEEEMAA